MRLGQRAGVTDAGRKRRRNEDAFVVDPPLFVVADGMGGAQAGEVASRLAAAAFREYHDADELAGDERVRAIIQEANRRIYERAQVDTNASGMGTTVTAAIVEGGRVALIRRVREGRTYYVFPGGGVEAGETAEAAAIREAHEELGVDVELDGLLHAEVFEGTEFLYFAATIVGGEFGTGRWPDHAHRPAQLRARRGTYEAVWVSRAELERHDVRPRALAERLAADGGA